MNTKQQIYDNLPLRLSISGVLIALGIVLSSFYIPVGASKCYFLQHLINVISAVLLGPVGAVINAFIISLLRNILGLGSLLAFPGSMIGALLAGILYKRFNNHRIACLGELLGTGFIGAIISAPIAVLIMGKEVGLFFFILPFFISSAAGSMIALILFESSSLLTVIRNRYPAS